jgi:hypothetical protein
MRWGKAGREEVLTGTEKKTPRVDIFTENSKEID